MKLLVCCFISILYMDSRDDLYVYLYKKTCMWTYETNRLYLNVDLLWDLLNVELCDYLYIA